MPEWPNASPGRPVSAGETQRGLRLSEHRAYHAAPRPPSLEDELKALRISRWSLQSETKDLGDARAEQLAGLRLTKRRRFTTAWHDEGVQAVSQHRQPCDLRRDPLFFAARRLENRAGIHQESGSRIARRHVRKKDDQAVLCHVEQVVRDGRLPLSDARIQQTRQMADDQVGVLSHDLLFAMPRGAAMARASC